MFIGRSCRQVVPASSAALVGNQRGAVALLFAAVAGSVWAAREHLHAVSIAEADFQSFHAAVPAARTLLIMSNPASKAEEREGIAAAKDVLSRYHALDNPRLDARRPVRLLDQESQAELAADIGDLKSLMARRDSSNSAPAASMNGAGRACDRRDSPSPRCHRLAR